MLVWFGWDGMGCFGLIGWVRCWGGLIGWVWCLVWFDRMGVMFGVGWLDGCDVWCGFIEWV